VARIFDLRKDSGPQVYGIGIKELWDVPAEQHQPGRVIHTQGWPLDDAWGGGFLYHQDNGQVALGFVVALDYKNPHLSPFEEFQRWKTHPAIRAEIEGGKRVSYGSRAINEGGWQAIPRLAFPGGALIGCAAGFVNVPRIKGSHTAMKSAMLAAETAFEALGADRRHDTLEAYEPAVRSSWIADELKMVRNAQPAIAKWGGTIGTMFAGMDMWLNYLKLRTPWTLKHHPDHEALGRKEHFHPIKYPKPGRETDLRPSVVGVPVEHQSRRGPAGSFDAEGRGGADHGQPCALRQPGDALLSGGVYEIVEEAGSPRLQINAQNCVHCKTCDIKDPTQNINWVVPEGGGGPNYPNM
jgi:electron-transferring-flavoprotein dehydrogenase